DELARFRQELRHFTAERRWGVSVVSLGDDVATLLAGRVARGVAPDVAMLPRPGLVAEDLTGLATVPDLTPPGVSTLWRALASPGGTTRGVWYKTAHKSLVWYRPDVLARMGMREPPSDWASWRDLRERCVRAGIAPLSIGAADGYVLTDWFENVLWGLDRVTYEALAGGTDSWDRSSVVRALELLAEVWSPPGTLPGGPARALVTQFEDSVLDVAVRGRAAMLVGADFVLPVVTRLAPQAPPLDWFHVPAPPGGVRPLIVAGDLAVLLAEAGPGGRELVDWLALPRAAVDWAAYGGFVSLRPEVTRYPPQYRPELLDEVRLGGPDEFGFDLSDRLRGGLSGGDGRGLWRLLQRFLAELGHGGDPEQTVEETVAALVAAAAPGAQP
ncbi:MAG TPA: ABC transporter substrate-binding protein, partial [Mycobacteriales bacterium]|nr:ABC transporter substrate-binding protein [Mycobacteriales bacterium]